MGNFFKNRVHGMGRMFSFPKKSMARVLLMLHVANSACLDEVARVSVSNSEEPNREDGGGRRATNKASKIRR